MHTGHASGERKVGIPTGGVLATFVPRARGDCLDALRERMTYST